MLETKTRPTEQKEQLTVTKTPLEMSFRAFYSIVGHVEAEYADQNKSIRAAGPEEYWARVSEVANHLGRHGYTEGKELALGTAIELTAATPYFLICQRRLDSTEHPSMHRLSPEELDEKKYFACHYQSQLLEFVRANPDVTAPEINEHLCAVLKASGLTRYPERFQRMLAAAINGVQHQAGTKQGLQTIGSVRDTTIEEDLRGMDQVFKPENHYAFGIDTKASTYGIAEITGDRAIKYAIHKGRLLLYSQLDDDDFNGGFSIDQMTAQRKGLAYKEIIETAIRTGELEPVEF